MMTTSEVSQGARWLGLVGWIVITAAAGTIGALASARAPAFYASLERPSWAPPAGVFGPVWTTLYVLMGIAAWLVWSERGLVGAGGALGLFVLQLVLNALWTWIFFAWHRGALALAEIVLLWLVILATLVAFWRIRPLAGVLLLPYLSWVSFATALTAAVWRLNPAALGAG